MKSIDTVRSDEVTWSAGLAKMFKFDFLDTIDTKDGKDGLRRWEIEWVRIVTECTLTPAASTVAYGKDFGRVVDRVQLRDGASGTRCDLQGTSIHSIERKERGADYVDPADSASATATTTRIFHYLPMSMWKKNGLLDERDTACPAAALRDGSCWVKMAPAVIVDDGSAHTVTLSACTFYLEAKFRRRKGRRPEVPARLCYAEFPLVNASELIAVNGSIRDVLIEADYGIGAATWKRSFATNYEQIDSATLDYQDVDRLSLVESYGQLGAREASDPYFAPANATPYGVPFYVAPPEAKLADLPRVSTLQIDLNYAPPTGTVAIVAYVPNDDPKFASKTTGIPADLIPDIKKQRAIVATRDGRKVRLHTLPKAIRERLPYKIDLNA